MTALEPPDTAPPEPPPPEPAAPTPPPLPQPRRPGPLRRAVTALPDAIPALGFLAAIGASVGLLGWTLLARPPLIAFVTSNALPKRARIIQIVWMAAGAALLGGLLPAVAGARRGVAALGAIANRLAPLLLAGFVPLLFRWKIWYPSAELSFLVLAAILALAAGPLFTRALGAPPLFPRLAGSPGLARLKARLRATPRWVGIAVAAAAALAYTIFFSFYTIRYHRNVHSTSYDLALENNLVWNILHRGSFFKTSPGLGPTASHFGLHAYFFAYVIAPVYALWQTPEMMLIIQAALMGGSALPLYFLAERRVGSGMAAVLAVCVTCYAPMHGANLYDFHYTPLSTFFLWLTFYLLDARRDRWAILAAIVTASVREDIPPGMVVIGLYFILSRERPRAGTILAAIAGVYFVVLKMIVMPRWLADSSSYTYIYQGLMPEGENGYGGVLKTVVGNPGFTLATLLKQEKLIYLLQILTPVAFVSVRRNATWVLFLPAILFTLLSTGYMPVIQTSFQYTAHWTTYIFLATAIHLGQMRQQGPEGRRRAAAWMCAIVLATLACSYQDGAFFQRQNVHGGFGLYKFDTDADDLQRRAEMRELVAMFPPRAKVAGSEHVVPQISSRPDAYTIRVGLFDADYILFELHDNLANEHELVAQKLHAGEFGVVAVRPHFALLKKGHSTSGNAALLAQLGR